MKTIEEINTICCKHKIRNYTINSDGTIDVNGDVNLWSPDEIKLTELPLKFNKVRGDFYCANNELTSLVGSPKEVGNNFNCNHNKLTSLEGCPEVIGGVFNVNHNPLTSLKFCTFKGIIIDFRFTNITPNSLFDLDDDTYEKAVRKFDKLHNYIVGSWYGYYFDITKGEFETLKRQYTIGRILA